MPYIDINITVRLNEQDKDKIKAKLGELITIIPGKSETGLMVGINDGYTIYLAGEKKEKAAYITVQLYKKSEFEYKSDFTGKVFAFFEDEFNIPGNCIYLNFGEHDCWGSRGSLRM